MKKIIWIVIGCAVVIGAGILIGRNRPQETPRLGSEGAEQEAESNDQESDKSAESVDSPPAKVSDAVLTLVDPETDYQTRLGAMRKLGYEIPRQDLDALKDFLVADIPADVKIPRGAYNSIRNDLYEVLLRQKEMPEGLGDLLVGVVNNPGQDGMWRNYCIQFMQPFYERQFEVGNVEQTLPLPEVVASGSEASLRVQSAQSADGQAGKPAPHDELSVVRDALWNALGERENSNAGTALLGLDKLSRNYPEFDREEIDAAMLDLASD